MAPSHILQIFLRVSVRDQVCTASVYVEMASSCIVLHTCVLSALRHLYSCDFRYTVPLIGFWIHSRLERAGIVIPEENKKGLFIVGAEVYNDCIEALWNDIKSMKTSSLSNCSDRLAVFYSFDFLYSVPQISIASIMGRMDSPKSERAYSTLGGTSG